jgi:hypothetical protein
MAAISFPVQGLQSIPRDQLESAPTTAEGPQAVEPNQQGAPQGDTVTISATFPPANAPQQAATVQVQNFSVFLTQTEVQIAQANAAANDPATPPQTAAAQAQAANQPNAQAAAGAATAAADPAVAAFNAATNQAGATSTPQQELVQLDQTLQQLGIDPQTISLFNRLGLLLYANDPVALQNLVHALQTVDQQLGQLGQLGAATNTTNAANATNQPQAAAAQGLLPPALQAQAQVQTQAIQGNAQITPEPLTPLQAAALTQAAAAAPGQVQAQNQNQPGNAAANTLEVQLSFSDVQATIEAQTPTAQGTAPNQPAANNNANAPAAQTNNLLVNLQDFQLTFQAVEEQVQLPQAAGQGNSATQGQGQALNVLF